MKANNEDKFKICSMLYLDGGISGYIGRFYNLLSLHVEKFFLREFSSKFFYSLRLIL